MKHRQILYWRFGAFVAVHQGCLLIALVWAPHGRAWLWTWHGGKLRYVA